MAGGEFDKSAIFTDELAIGVHVDLSGSEEKTTPEPKSAKFLGQFHPAEISVHIAVDSIGINGAVHHYFHVICSLKIEGRPNRKAGFVEDVDFPIHTQRSTILNGFNRVLDFAIHETN